MTAEKHQSWHIEHFGMQVRDETKEHHVETESKFWLPLKSFAQYSTRLAQQNPHHGNSSRVNYRPPWRQHVQASTSQLQKRPVPCFDSNSSEIPTSVQHITSSSKTTRGNPLDDTSVLSQRGYDSFSPFSQHRPDPTEKVSYSYEYAARRRSSTSLQEDAFLKVYALKLKRRIFIVFVRNCQMMSILKQHFTAWRTTVQRSHSVRYAYTSFAAGADQRCLKLHLTQWSLAVQHQTRLRDICKMAWDASGVWQAKRALRMLVQWKDRKCKKRTVLRRWRRVYCLQRFCTWRTEHTKTGL
jgi:hypothetical protein